MNRTLYPPVCSPRHKSAYRGWKTYHHRYSWWTTPRKAGSRLFGRSNRSDLSRMLQPWQKAVPSLHGSRVMQCKQKGNACYMLYPSGTSELATTRLVTTDANSISFRFHPWISFCASFQSSKSSAIHAFTIGLVYIGLVLASIAESLMVTWWISTVKAVDWYLSYLSPWTTGR